MPDGEEHCRNISTFVCYNLATTTWTQQVADAKFIYLTHTVTFTYSQRRAFTTRIRSQQLRRSVLP